MLFYLLSSTFNLLSLRIVVKISGMKTINENNNFPMNKQILNDEHMDNPSFMGFRTFNFDISEVIIVTLRIGNRHLVTKAR